MSYLTISSSLSVAVTMAKTCKKYCQTSFLLVCKVIETDTHSLTSFIFGWAIKLVFDQQSLSLFWSDDNVKVAMRLFFVIIFLLDLITQQHGSDGAAMKGESQKLIILSWYSNNLILVGQCQKSNGKCSEASDCKYIWTDTFDCTAKYMVCCYNNRIYSNHDYVDLGWEWQGNQEDEGAWTLPWDNNSYWHVSVYGSMFI